MTRICEGYFFGKKFSASTCSFWGGMSKVGIFGGIQNNLKICSKELLPRVVPV